MRYFLLVAGFLAVSALPAHAQRACTMEAKACPDGSYVSRTGPNCEFTPCPSQSMPHPPQPPPEEKFPEDEGSGTSGTGTVQPGQPRVLPDEPVSGALQEPVTVTFLVEHRSALNEQNVEVHGIIVAALLADKACPPDRGACAQPRITLADTTSESRDKGYDLPVLLPEGDETPYSLGQILDISGTVSGETYGVVMTRNQ